MRLLAAWPAAAVVRSVRRDEVEQFRRDGYLVVDRRVVTGPALRQVRDLLDALFARATSLPRPWVHDLAPRTGSVPEVINTAHLEPRLLRTAAYWTMSRSAAKLLGAPVRLLFDHAIVKTPKHGDCVALHQDLAFNPKDDFETATIWLALDDATLENGCMRFVPGRPELLPHRRVGRDGLAVEGVDEGAAVACQVPAGGFTVHSQRTVHGSGANTTDGTRAAWIMKFLVDRGPRRARIRDRSLELLGVRTPARQRELVTVSRSEADSPLPEWARRDHETQVIRPPR